MDVEITRIVENVVKFVGSEKNILAVKRCKTRLRLKLKDKKSVDIGQFKKLEYILGIVETKEQFQIIIESQKATELIQEFNRVYKMKINK